MLSLARFLANNRESTMRHSKPWFRKQTKSWYVQIKGRQINLGRDKRLAKERFHRLISGLHEAPSELTAHVLLERYCDWMKINRSATTNSSRGYVLKSFRESLPQSLRANALKPHHVSEWLNPKHSPTTRCDRITTIKTIWNWGISMGYLESNPIARMEKPRRQIRQDFLPVDVWPKLLDSARDREFRDFLTVMLMTGARTQEMLRFEAKHFDRNRLILPIEDSKGCKRSRVVYLPDETIAIIERLIQASPTGPIFRNSLGVPWNRNSIRCRFKRLKKLLGMPGLCSTTLRHSYAHHRLISGQDALTISKLMGHVNTNMLSTLYGHLDAYADYMLRAANQIRLPAD